MVKVGKKNTRITKQNKSTELVQNLKPQDGYREMVTTKHRKTYFKTGNQNLNKYDHNLGEICAGSGLKLN